MLWWEKRKEIISVRSCPFGVMALCFYLMGLLVIANGISISQANSTGIIKALKVGAGYLLKSKIDLPLEILSPPQNTNSSIQYLLFTPDHSETPCFLEPNRGALKRCPFNSSLPFKILIHGFRDQPHPMGKFLKIKDEMLKHYQYNVIVMNWGKYSQEPYFAASANSIIVGNKLARLIQYLQKHANLDSKSIHLIGHSLGAHLAGAVGKTVPNIGRITGLDPAYRLFYQTNDLPRLSYSDADFVDIIHSSNSTEGFGESEPMACLDFYPNGGGSQPKCQNKTDDSSFLKKRGCNHLAAVNYFHQSINPSKCRFLASNCNNYTNFLQGLCPSESTPMAEMGLPAKPIPGLPPKSKFYLRTSANKPYCLQDGYEALKQMR